MSTYFAILTQIGEAKLANAIALGQTLTLNKMGVGDGNGVLPTPDRTQKTLVREVRRADLNQLTVDPANSSQIVVEQVLPEDVGGWWIREIGVYDQAGDLCAVANCPPSYKPVMAEGSGRTQVVRVVLIVASTAAIELKIDPSVVLATRKYADDQDIEVRAYADAQLAAHSAAGDPHAQYKKKDQAVLYKSVAGKTDVVLTDAEARNDVLNFTGVLTGNISVIVPTTARSWTASNKTTGAFALTFRTAAGSGLVIGQGQTRVPYCDGVDILSRITEGTTPPQFDASTKLATMEAVQRAIGGFAGSLILTASAIALAPAHVNKFISLISASTQLVSLPLLSTVAPGSSIAIHNPGSIDKTVTVQGTDVISPNGNNFTAITVSPGDTVIFTHETVWRAHGTGTLKYSANFAANFAQNTGQYKLPNGMTRKYGTGNLPATGASATSASVVFPNAFITAALTISAMSIGNANSQSGLVPSFTIASLTATGFALVADLNYTGNFNQAMNFFWSVDGY